VLKISSLAHLRYSLTGVGLMLLALRLAKFLREIIPLGAYLDDPLRFSPLLIGGQQTYTLFLQKQPGTLDTPVEVTVTLPEPVEVTVTLPEGAQLLESQPQPEGQ
jgi:hypothetical protein